MKDLQGVLIMIGMVFVVYLLTGTESCGKPMMEGCKSRPGIELVPSVPVHTSPGFHP